MSDSVLFPVYQVKEGMTKMKIGFTDVFFYAGNNKGVEYLYNHYTKEVIAKRCTCCKDWYFLKGFNKAGKGFAGTHSLCRNCHRETNKKYRNDKKDYTHLMINSGRLF